MPDKFLIVAIGSSAGGVNTLGEFLSKIDPKLEVAYIIVQHLSSSVMSQLEAILQTHTSLPIVSIEDNMQIETRKVYIATPKKHIIVKNNQFLLTDGKEIDFLRPSINQLFNSIALEYKEKAVGILLTGSGKDGVEGLKNIKKYGGWTLAQDPALASYPQMPQNAIDNVAIDFVLSVRDIPSYIAEIFYEPDELQKELSSEEYNKIIDFIAGVQNTKFSNYKQTTIKRRIKNRIATLGLKTPDDYFKFLRENEQEVEQLIKNLLINVTGFFRDLESFERLKIYVEDMIFNKSSESSIRVWIAGCSTGEEAYSIAIILNEILSETFDQREVKIFATDVDIEVVEKARQGVYTKEQLLPLPEKIRSKYFYKFENRYKVIKSLRDKIIFGINDLTTSAPIAKVDLISCRNVLIYFDKELQKKILRLFHYALNKDSLLFLGNSESNLLVPELFSALDSKSKIYKKINMNISVTTKKQSILYSQDRVEQESFSSGFEYNQIAYFFEKILQNTNDAIIAVDTKKRILSINQTALEMFDLEEEQSLNFNIDDVLKGFIEDEFYSYLEQTFQTNTKMIKELHIFQNALGESFYFQVTFIPFTHTPNNVEQVILIIRDITLQHRLKSQIRQLKQKNKEQISQLNILNEELQVTNEELETVNEELQATNEELETTNEELQAVNEELQTSNEALHIDNDFFQSKNRELNLTNVSLEEMIELKVKEIRKKDKLLIQQSKMAAMGEMIGAIAHQWRQPLNALGISIQTLLYEYKAQNVNEEFINDFISKNKQLIMFMSKTIDDFRNFFRMDKEKKDFFVKRSIQSVVQLISAQLENHNISLEISGDDFSCFGYENEFRQVILNILTNAKDILVEKEVKDKKIKIEIKDKQILIQDNAGGIDKSIINRVFEPYFTTKEDGKGTGIGLYMAKVIIEENMGGKIYVQNIEHGALFIVELK